MIQRPPSPPPQLPGYEYEKLLGSGGFADVFLYRQHRPQRQVAIKVLLSDALDDAVHKLFEAEANVMASMSTHPSIVSIYAAEVSSDHRPYLVMEYCSRPNYGVRFRRERISVTEALRVGVQIAGAVETSHRAGILHRDIKPANILVTDYNRPALTDFGISVAAGQGNDLEDSQGLSIPWSPPEFFADPPFSNTRSDVFSLAASIYSLLAGHTPFERVGTRNSASDLIHRIANEPLPSLGRPDVPPELERVLAIAMAKDPRSRYDNALAFGRALQQVERALSLPVTQMDVLDDRAASGAESQDEDELDAHTRIRRVSTVDPDSASRPRARDPFDGVAPALGSPAAHPGAPSAGGSSTPMPESSGESTLLRPASPRTPPPEAAAPAAAQSTSRGVPAWPFITLAALFVVVLGVGSTFLVRHFVAEPEPSPTATAPPPTLPQSALEPPEEVTAAVIVEETEGAPGKTRVRWEIPESTPPDTYYQVRWVDLPPEYSDYQSPHEVYGRASTVVDIPPNLDEHCLEVDARSADGPVSAPVEVCLEDG